MHFELDEKKNKSKLSSDDEFDIFFCNFYNAYLETRYAVRIHISRSLQGLKLTVLPLAVNLHGVADT